MTKMHRKKSLENPRFLGRSCLAPARAVFCRFRSDKQLTQETLSLVAHGAGRQGHTIHLQGDRPITGRCATDAARNVTTTRIAGCSNSRCDGRSDGRCTSRTATGITTRRRGSRHTNTKRASLPAEQNLIRLRRSSLLRATERPTKLASTGQ